MSRHITWQTYESRQARWAQLGQSPAIAWLTGLSGAGKTCIADAVDRTLATHGRHVVVLDGDNLRHGLNRDLGFTSEDRAENVRRAAEVACLMAETGLIVIVALISPLSRERAQARDIAGKLPFLEVFVDTPLSACESRDPKGLYALARTGRISQFTGISAPYEAPEAPDLTIRTEALTVAQSAAPLSALLLQISARPT